MSWAGSIALTNGQARGAMVDPWDWEIALGGSLEGFNRLFLLAALATEGRPAPEGSADHELHRRLLRDGAVLRGEMLRGPLGWTGSLGGALRLSSTSPLGTGPIGLRGEPL